MMNHKGQTVVAFVIIVPVFILFLAFVVDTGYLYKEYTRLESVTKTVLKTTYESRLESDYKEQVKNLFEKNNVSTKNLKIEINDAEVSMKNNYDINSIFGSIIGLKKYPIKINMKVIKLNEKLIVKKE